MRQVYISEDGDDANSGSSPETAIHSWRRALSLSDGNTEFRLMGLSTLERLTKEIEGKIRQERYSKTDLG
jgi:hypothetical protein